MNHLTTNVFEMIWHDIPTGLWLFDEFGNLTECNRAYENMLGSVESELVGDGWARFVHPEDREPILELVWNALEYREEAPFEFRVLQECGKLRYLSARMKPIFENGVFVGYIGIVQDITEQEETEEHLKIARSELIEKEKLATIGQTTAVVAHELRNPLATIRNAIFVLQRYNLEEKAQNNIDRCDRSIKRCDKIIQELLDFTKSTHDKKEWFLLHEEVGLALDAMDKPNNMEVRTDLQPVRPMNGVPTKIARAVVNIVQNAFDVTRELVEAKLFVRVKESGDRAWVIIANSGSHIDEDVIECIFEPLFSTKGFGVGLGLPVARKMFEEHGGGLVVKNLPHDGVMFAGWVSLEDIEHV